MIYISHRGNLTGKHHDLENSPVYVYQAIDRGFDVEVDLRHKDGQIFLGHEKPQYLIDDNFINNNPINDYFINNNLIDDNFINSINDDYISPINDNLINLINDNIIYYNTDIIEYINNTLIY